jgi:hypothetical protein
VLARREREGERADLVDDALLGDRVGAQPHRARLRDEERQRRVGDDPRLNARGGERARGVAALEPGAALGHEHAGRAPGLGQREQRGPHAVARRQRRDPRLARGHELGGHVGRVGHRPLEVAPLGVAARGEVRAQVGRAVAARHRGVGHGERARRELVDERHARLRRLGRAQPGEQCRAQRRRVGAAVDRGPALQCAEESARHASGPARIVAGERLGHAALTSRTTA